MTNENIDFDKLEEAKFKIDKSSFSPNILHCSNCNIKMKKTVLEIGIDDTIYLRLDGFACQRCNKQYLGLEEAKKIDKAMIFKRALNRDFKMERSLSFDGDNYTFRIPKEFTNKVRKRKIEIVPLGAREFCAVVE